MTLLDLLLSLMAYPFQLSGDLILIPLAFILVSFSLALISRLMRLF